MIVCSLISRYFNVKNYTAETDDDPFRAVIQVSGRKNERPATMSAAESHLELFAASVEF
jgi:hypothetical protein